MDDDLKRKLIAAAATVGGYGILWACRRAGDWRAAGR